MCSKMAGRQKVPIHTQLTAFVRSPTPASKVPLARPNPQFIHITCVPIIYTSALYFLQQAPLPAAFVAAVGLPSVGYASTFALPVALGYAGFYAYLAPNFLGLTAGALAVAALPLASTLTLAAGPVATKAAIGAHVAAWILQFYGHGVHEGRSPALLDNLGQALFMAPLFVYTETLMKLGFLKNFKDAVESVIDAKIALFRMGASKAK